MNEPAVTIRTFLDATSDLAGSELETAVREWADTNCTWDIFERSVRAGWSTPVPKTTSYAHRPSSTWAMTW